MLTVTVAASAVTVATTAMSVLASAGCDDDDPPKVDAGTPDTPLI